MPRQATSGLRTPLHTSLPAAPLDGQEILFLADAANGIVWRLRYRAASSSPYKWEFVGGPSLRALAGANDWNAPGETTAAVNFATLTTPGPAVVAPLAGDYDVAIQAMGLMTGVGGAPSLAIWVTGDAVAPWNYGAVFYPSSTSGAGTLIHCRGTRIGVAVGANIEPRYATSNASNPAKFYSRAIFVTPVRVG